MRLHLSGLRRNASGSTPSPANQDGNDNVDSDGSIGANGVCTTGGDKTHTMFNHLVSAKLNLLIGAEAGCISGTVGLADAWMATYPVGSNVKGSSLAWKNGEPLSVQLDRYNNGMLCAPHRD